MPLPGDCQELGGLERSAVELKRGLVASDLTERTFVQGAVASSLAESWSRFEQRSEDLAAVLHAIEGLAEREAFASLRLDDEDVAAVLDETGTPAGWYPFVSGYDDRLETPEHIKVQAGLLAPLDEQTRIKPPPDRLAALKCRLRALYEAGPGASADVSEEIDGADDGDDESQEVSVSGARIPIPAETFLEELSQKLEVQPISVYWLLRELREKDGVACRPELQRFIADHFTVMILRLLGHQWPRQIEAKEPIPDWAEPGGVIPITESTEHEALIARVRRRIAAEFGLDRVSAIEREFEEIMGVPLETWLARDFFRNHISQFRKRPIAWHLESIAESGNSGKRKGAKRKARSERAPAFSCLIYYHRLGDQLLGTVRTQYVRPMRLRMETEIRELARIASRAAQQDERRAELMLRTEELKDFEAKLESVETGGFACDDLSRIATKEPLDKWSSADGKREYPRERSAFIAQEKRYDPDINDGVRVNVAPLQKAGLLAADVLAAKDVEKAVSDRAEWRADERRWCRAGKLPHPGWWQRTA